MSLRYVERVAKISCISITNVLSVSAYDTITTKPISNILFLCNLIVGGVRELLKRRLVFCFKSIDLENVFKSWGEYDSSK